MRIATGLTAALFLAACGAPDDQSASGVDANCFNRTSSEIGGPFSLTAHTGETVTERDFAGDMTLVFFGFTYCPDVCPITLYKAGQAVRDLPEGAAVPKTIFISIDPERDTPETLSLYVKSNGFPEDITGLTGAPEQLEAVSTAFAAPYERVEDSSTASGYLMNHSSILYLMDKDWKLATFFTPSDTPETMSACIAAIGAGASLN